MRMSMLYAGGQEPDIPIQMKASSNLTRQLPDSKRFYTYGNYTRYVKVGSKQIRTDKPISTTGKNRY